MSEITNSSPSIEVCVNKEILNYSNKSKINETSEFNLSSRKIHYTSNSNVDQLNDVITELKNKCKTNQKNLNKSKNEVELIKLKIKRLKILEEKAKTTYNNKIKNLRDIRKNKEQKILHKKIMIEQENQKNIDLIKKKQHIQSLRENMKNNLEKAKKNNENTKEKNAKLIHNQKMQLLFTLKKERQDDFLKKREAVTSARKMVEDSEKKKRFEFLKKQLLVKKNLENIIISQLQENKVVQKELKNYQLKSQKIIVDMGKFEGIVYV